MASFGNLNITQENRFPQNFSSISACDTFYESACHVGKRANNIIVKYNFFHDTISQYCDRLSRQSCWVIQVATAFSQRLEVEVVMLCHVMSHHGIIEVYVQLPTFRGEVPQLSKIWFFFLSIWSLIPGGLYQQSGRTVGISGDRGPTSKCLDLGAKFPRVGTKNFSDTRFIVTLPFCGCQRPNH